MRMALVCDCLCDVAGTERVFQYVCQAFDDADIYATAFNASRTLPYFATRKINTTWLNPVVQSRKAFVLSFPLATYAMQSLDLSDYDCVLSCSATVAKYIKTAGVHICYCYIPTRALWQFDVYFGSSWKTKILKITLPYLRARDLNAAGRIDHFLAISQVTRNYIRQFYDKPAEVIPSPIDLSAFRTAPKQHHFLLVSRLERWKKVDYAIEAFNKTGAPLKIIGTGEQEHALRSMANKNIEFLGPVDDEQLAKEYSEATAVIFTPNLEYGLVPLEANASGTPVISFGKGGITETMVPVKDNNEDGAGTAVFFYEQTADSLMGAMQQFESCVFDPAKLMHHAAQWSIPVFQDRLRAAVASFSRDKQAGA